MSTPVKFKTPSFRSVSLPDIRLAHGAPVTTATRVRWAAQIFFLLMLVIVPATHLLKLDLANDRYFLLRDEVSFGLAMQAVVALWLGIFIINFFENYLIGRLLCGYVCSWGLFNRLGRMLNHRLRHHPRRALAVVALDLAIALVATVMLLNFGIDLGTLLLPAHPAFAAAWAAFVVLAAIGFVILQRMGFRFCETVCPFGMYLTVVRQPNSLRIAFDASRACVECGLCTQVCPMSLSPRELDFKDRFNGGHSQCVLCGDCVDVCTTRMAAEQLPPPLRWNVASDIIPLEAVRHEPRDA